MSVDTKEQIAEAILCGVCRGVNIYSVIQDGGYPHYTLDLLVKSSDSCALCKILLSKIYGSEVDDITLDRYRVVLTTSKEPRDRSKSGHFVSDSRPYASFLWVSLVDTRPHELLEEKLGSVWRLNDKTYRYERSSVGQNCDNEDHVVERKPMMCYTERDDPAAEKGMPWLRAIGNNTGSEGSLNIAKQWLSDCIRAEKRPGSKSAYSDNMVIKYYLLEVPPVEFDHAWSADGIKSIDKPDNIESQNRPARLLLIMDPEDSQLSDVRLVATSEIVPPYATLSYCWGKGNPKWLCTTSKLNEYLERIDRSILPATISDCITAVASLGICYIWIDALCILQDSIPDWASESAKMSDIYYKSLITIAAARSPDSDTGCFIEPPGRLVGSNKFPPGTAADSKPRLAYSIYRPLGICIENVVQGGAISRLYIPIYALDSPDDDCYTANVSDSPLAERAWVLQEQALSRRVLYFGKDRLFWECDHCRLSDDNWPQRQGDHIYPIMALRKPLSTEIIVDKWYLGVVQSYSRRKLTRPSDKMVAISALARATYRNRNIEYIAGLWKDCLMAGLMWHRSSPGVKSLMYTGPSWSWASQDSSVDYRLVCGRSGRLLFYQPKVIDVSAGSITSDPFGDATGARITLDTMITQVYITRRSLPYSYHRSQFARESMFLDEAHVELHGVGAMEAMMDDEDDGDENAGSIEATAALLSDHFGWLVGLLLKPVPGEMQIYRRVGIMLWELPDGVYQINDIRNLVHWEKQIITIC